MLKTYEKIGEFTFNELNYFTNLINNENLTLEQKEEMISNLELEDVTYKFIYEKDNKGSLFMHCFKNDISIKWDDIQNWMRPYVWEFQRNNKIL